MRRLSQRESSLIAIGLLVLALALIWAFLIAPFASGFAERGDQREMLRMAYERNSRLINAIPAMRRQAEKQRGLGNLFLIAAPNAGLARGKLRERLRGQISAVGGQVTAVQDVPSAPGTVRAWVQGRMTLAQLSSLLAATNDTPPYLVIESLRISADRALETGHLDILDIRLEASIPTFPAAS